MYCISCKSIVERQLTNESGIKRIDVDYMTDSVNIEFDPSIITKEEIKGRLETDYQLDDPCFLYT